MAMFPALLVPATSSIAQSSSLPATTTTRATALPATVPTNAQRVLIVGDSLSAEYGLQRGQGWAALLERRLTEEKIDAAVINASISGDTTSGGLARLAPLLARYKPTHVLIELGGNDALRGLSLPSMQANLVSMTKAAKTAGAKVLLIGLQIPPNYGRKFSDDFAAVYGTVAKQEKVPLVPFFLKGVADIDNPESMFQADRIHPLPAAHPLMLGNVWPVLRPMLK